MVIDLCLRVPLVQRLPRLHQMEVVSFTEIQAVPLEKATEAVTRFLKRHKPEHVADANDTRLMVCMHRTVNKVAVCAVAI